MSVRGWRGQALHTGVKHCFGCWGGTKAFSEREKKMAAQQRQYLPLRSERFHARMIAPRGHGLHEAHGTCSGSRKQHSRNKKRKLTLLKHG